MKDLTPLTPEQQAEFETHRVTDAVVQNRCSCGAWYETNRMVQPFRETFLCDCGKRMEFDVPAAPFKLIDKPTNEQIMSALDPDARLDTGMKVSEAIRLAGQWWDKIGRNEMLRHKVRQERAGTPFASEDPTSENYLPSGIVHGYVFHALSKAERLRVVKIWHHFHVRKPDLIGGEENEHKLSDRASIQ